MKLTVLRMILLYPSFKQQRVWKVEFVGLFTLRQFEASSPQWFSNEFFHFLTFQLALPLLQSHLLQKSVWVFVYQSWHVTFKKGQFSHVGVLNLRRRIKMSIKAFLSVVENSTFKVCCFLLKSKQKLTYETQKIVLLIFTNLCQKFELFFYIRAFGQQSNPSRQPPPNIDHLPTMTTILSLYNMYLSLNNGHLLKTAKNLGTRGWSLNTGLNVIKS